MNDSHNYAPSNVGGVPGLIFPALFFCIVCMAVLTVIFAPTIEEVAHMISVRSFAALCGLSHQ